MILRAGGDLWVVYDFGFFIVDIPPSQPMAEEMNNIDYIQVLHYQKMIKHKFIL